MSGYYDEKDVTIRTGRVEIDQQMGGGIPQGSLTLVEGKHGTGKSVFCQHLVHSALDSRKSVAFYSSETSSPTGARVSKPAATRQGARELVIGKCQRPDPHLRPILRDTAFGGPQSL